MNSARDAAKPATAGDLVSLRSEVDSLRNRVAELEEIVSTLLKGKKERVRLPGGRGAITFDKKAHVMGPNDTQVIRYK